VGSRWGGGWGAAQRLFGAGRNFVRVLSVTLPAHRMLQPRRMPFMESGDIQEAKSVGLPLERLRLKGKRGSAPPQRVADYVRDSLTEEKHVGNIVQYLD